MGARVRYSVWMLQLIGFMFGHGRESSLLVSRASRLGGLYVRCGWISPSEKNKAILRLDVSGKYDSSGSRISMYTNDSTSFYIASGVTGELKCVTPSGTVRYAIEPEPDLQISQHNLAGFARFKCGHNIDNVAQFKGGSSFSTIRWWNEDNLLVSVRFTVPDTTETYFLTGDSYKRTDLDISSGDLILSVKVFGSRCISCQIFRAHSVSHIRKQCWFPSPQHHSTKMLSPNPTLRCECVGTAIRTGIFVVVFGMAIALVVIIYHQRTRSPRSSGNDGDESGDAVRGGRMLTAGQEGPSASGSSLSSLHQSVPQISNVTRVSMDRSSVGNCIRIHLSLP